jgi:hypothetical protein
MRRGALVAAIASLTLLGACVTVGPSHAPPAPVADDALGVIAQTLLDSAASKYRRVAPSYDPARGYPFATKADGRWSTVPAGEWTSGYYAGTLRYLHEYTLDPVLRAQAERFALPVASDSSIARGLRDSTTWTRRQAWAIYHATTLYRETRDPRVLGEARRRAGDVLRRLPDDVVPCWDDQGSGCPDRSRRDAASAAIMASALLELSTFVRGDDSLRYRATAEQMLAALTAPAYLAPNGSAALLLHSVGDRRRGGESDVGIVYADYYFVEALLRYLELSGQSGVRVLGRR